jgi:hypothetical protein
MSRALDMLRGGWRCHSCNEDHQGLMGLSAIAPWHWGDRGEPEPNHAFSWDKDDVLTEDFCVIAETNFFVRGCLEIPVRGLDEAFSFGAWSSLSDPNFESYVGSFNGNAAAADHAWTGWFANMLDPFSSSLNAPCWVETRSGRQRPLFWLADDAHPLALAQRDGIQPEQLLDIYRANGHAID